ncbi:CTP synthase [Sulfolobus acidocaldarius]|uniref:CTP synthase n=4 Tax=Sulfolobus acidocaldarius TaxID=2285 RepID=PYRG_SULAC|nr:CTP synthase [Sulfolobus acidocaldarius]Q4JAK8.1 RecName: Full=CTP synthase; AltName: Full=Cytidine 5'-triphosphate synthase; AltName: Full=Cytidine triphosphate synthetase; Short=CTP synthetase; Short=CTPS; AltName: Full=UTP--ammonia ligase [Sulfolobus acidocaldarius DSM 639]AAY80171.1 CTP synthase [Sulfolobus acidocaldarius DSM 639]AGE70749.1 CTP synthetase [Sulfolobus acidocaldarius N8]AGE73020.1 CTP synthetase [Sulfolobus acidocaldarius Ron12/I]ALU31646.1 CTP synthetase [Sulfolobus acid
MTKYIIVTGGVLSSVGKGTIVASIGFLLKSSGYNVTAIKVDPYLNVDAGTMNPYMHGEVFVTDDGAETDLDLGHYERFIGINTTRYNNITAGRVYFEVIRKEREGKYLGQTVQIIPHVTDEIKGLVKKAVDDTNAEIAIIEIGGTVGDIEGLPFLEAVRQMKLEEEENLMFIHVALVEYLRVTGELKTKPLQHSVQELRRIGIQPDMIIARSILPLDEETKKKIALFTNVKPDYILSNYDVELTYEVPLILEKQNITKKIFNKLGLEPKEPKVAEWLEFVENMKNPSKEVKIALVGKYTKLKDSYLSIKEAIYHAAAKLRVKPTLVWVESSDLEKSEDEINKLKDVNGIIVLPGFGARGVEGKIQAIKFARENNIPFLGICFGMQLAIVEYARNVLGLKEANTTEVNPNTKYPIITLLDNQKKIVQVGGTMRLGAQKIILKEGTLAYSIYNSPHIYERHRHRYEVNPEYVDLLQKYGMIISGVSENGLVEIIELKNHKFFLGTQAHPEYKSRPLSPSPVFLNFLSVASA